jgi:DNA-binding response OmpR family regulator
MRTWTDRRKTPAAIHNELHPQRAEGLAIFPGGQIRNLKHSSGMGLLRARGEIEPPLVLLIENDDSDVFLFRRALSHLRFRGDVRTVGSATEASAYLNEAAVVRESDYYRLPGLIVSDFKLVGHTALDFVRWLRRDARFTSIPLVILSGVITERDTAVLFNLGVRAFLHKTADVEALGALLRPYLPVTAITR